MTGRATLLEARLILLAERRRRGHQRQAKREQRRRQACHFELALVDQPRLQITDLQADFPAQIRQPFEAFKIDGQRQLIRLETGSVDVFPTDQALIEQGRMGPVESYRRGETQSHANLLNPTP